MGQLSLFPEATAPSSSLVGLRIPWPSPCRCGGTAVTLGSSKTIHEAAIRCSECGTHRGWLSKQEVNALRAKIVRLGKRPTTHSGRT